MTLMHIHGGSLCKQSDSYIILARFQRYLPLINFHLLIVLIKYCVALLRNIDIDLFSVVSYRASKFLASL